MDEYGWITDSGAIDTLVALKELKLGDEIQIHDPENNYRLVCYHGKVVRVIEDNNGFVGQRKAISDCPWADEICVAQFDPPDGDGGTWVVCRKNIAAWRRPRKL